MKPCLVLDFGLSPSGTGESSANRKTREGCVFQLSLEMGQEAQSPLLLTVWFDVQQRQRGIMRKESFEHG